MVNLLGGWAEHAVGVLKASTNITTG